MAALRRPRRSGSPAAMCAVTTRNRRQTAGRYALPFRTSTRQVGPQSDRAHACSWIAGRYPPPAPSRRRPLGRRRGLTPAPLSVPGRGWGRGIILALLPLVLLSGCGAKPKVPTAPTRTHIEQATDLLPRLPTATPWLRFTFNDWEALRARAGLGDTPVAQWTTSAHLKASDTLQGWLLPPSSIPASAALAPFGIDGATMRWQIALDGARDQPITRLVTAPARDDRPTQVGTMLAPLGYAIATAATPPAGPVGPVIYQRPAGVANPLPPLLDANAAALVATPGTLVTVHDAGLAPDALASLQPDGANLNALPFFNGLTTGISDVEAMALFRAGADGYRDATAPPLDVANLPFDAVGAALHITDAGAQYATLAFHIGALPGGHLPEGMAEWWATRLGLDRPDPRADYLEAFGNDGWLFARYRILSPGERLGVAPPGEVPFWKSVTTWQSIHQRWIYFTPRTADPIPRIGT
jgi:hypothetical protein